MSVTESDVRRAIAGARTMVVKVGSSSLTQPSGHLDVKKLNSLVAALSAASAQGARVVLVSSGAIAAGFGPLGFESRPSDVATQQAVAAVGQGLLMAQYEAAFGRFGVRVGQILITAEDTIRAVQYRNVQRTLNRLLELGVVPIVNENDSLASNEIRFGDNDRLSALVANLVRADALVLLTDVDGLYTAPPSTPGARRIGFVPNVIDTIGDVQVAGSSSGVGTGGMVTKLDGARVGHSRRADERDEHRPGADGRSGRHGVRAGEAPRFIASAVDRLRVRPAWSLGGGCRCGQGGSRRACESARRRRRGGSRRILRRRPGVD